MCDIQRRFEHLSRIVSPSSFAYHLVTTIHHFLSKRPKRGSFTFPISIIPDSQTYLLDNTYEHSDFNRLDSILPEFWDITVSNNQLEFLTDLRFKTNYAKLQFNLFLGKTTFSTGCAIPNDYRSKCTEVLTSMLEHWYVVNISTLVAIAISRVFC